MVADLAVTHEGRLLDSHECPVFPGILRAEHKARFAVSAYEEHVGLRVTCQF